MEKNTETSIALEVLHDLKVANKRMFILFAIIVVCLVGYVIYDRYLDTITSDIEAVQEIDGNHNTYNSQEVN